MRHHPIHDEHRAGGDDYLRSRKHTIADQALTHLLDDRCELPSPNKGERSSGLHSTIWRSARKSCGASVRLKSVNIRLERACRSSTRMRIYLLERHFDRNYSPDGQSTHNYRDRWAFGRNLPFESFDYYGRLQRRV